MIAFLIGLKNQNRLPSGLPFERFLIYTVPLRLNLTTRTIRSLGENSLSNIYNEER